MGNVTRDPDIRYTVAQKAVATFTVAVNRSWRDQNGEIREDVAFIPVVVWGKTAELCEKYLRKGSGVLVEGRINTRSYEAKATGEKRYVTEVVADTLQFVGARPEGAGVGQGDGGSSYRGNSGYQGGGYQNSRQSAPVSRGGYRDNQPYQGVPENSMEAFPMDISGLDSSAGAMPDMSPGDNESDIPF